MKLINLILMSVMLVLARCHGIQGEPEHPEKGMLVRTNPEYEGHLLVKDLRNEYEPYPNCLINVYEDYFFIEYFNNIKLCMTDLPYNEETVKLDSVSSEHIIDMKPFIEKYWCETNNIDYIKDFIINNELKPGVRIK